MRTPAYWRHDGPAARLLQPLAAVYGAGEAWRRRRARPARVAVPVLCVGNLVAGGAGKTPVALSLLERLQAAGRRPHALLRGYGGRSAGPLLVDPAAHDAGAVGDEALLLARRAPTWIARDRLAGARAAAAAGAELLVLDDGFQNPRLAKDLSLLVVDGDYGFGNGRLLPAGPLREPPAVAYARTQAIVLLDEDRHGLAQGFPAGLPVLRGRLRPLGGGELAGRRVLAFAGIARPEKLVHSLEALGAEVAAARGFSDHHAYSAPELEALFAQAEKLDALAVTTEKDAVRLSPEQRARVAVLPVAVAWDEPAAVDALLQGLFDDG